jgi:DNA-binding Lrp family transcriptional regulator
MFGVSMATPEKDDQLIALLRENARLSVSDLARRLNVSRTSAQVRLEKLERSGVIAGYTVRVSKEFDANRVRALVMIKSAPSNRATTEKSLSDFPNLTTLYSISGAFDLVAEISTRSVEQLDKVIDSIGALEGVDDTLSSVILSTKIAR